MVIFTLDLLERNNIFEVDSKIILKNQHSPVSKIFAKSELIFVVDFSHFIASGKEEHDTR